ncbi:hypothetical protein TVAG_247520 [Trichomonas vaginalis G3]|uniref:Thioredoxin domain-containing protein n=1 Tax=Trichomonas vaginalis (strain ATCC PRA-98 / G3) TaxID=412133 RepID=A2DKU0_TRIV3|nr:disulfide-isomerase C17h9.14C-related family [Trichomonas vaginalis G3]EAY19073.1 hypothetical protein TVAG_247520 [Trichomonas vaginalis G3]KAI5521122.1 disulfide-isomerase C17h9.14C-related family [Trichomonas vaginalis G3]|eukprot:XP_001580059.1 hypothetical protein [Trichomonas vaginalis G3]
MILFTVLNIINAPTVANLIKDSYFAFTGVEDNIRVIHFYQKNCPACDSVEEVFEEVSRMYSREERVMFGQLDCDRATDVCESSSVRDYPAWHVYFKTNTHPKRYNRNFDVDSFVKFIRQGSGIRPTSNANNLLYIAPKDLLNITKKPLCNFVIVDKPMDQESQQLHNASRLAESAVRRGAKFFAVDRSESTEINKKLAGKSYSAFFVKSGKWTPYTGEEDKDSIVHFLRNQKCALTVATPTPTPKPLPELDDPVDDDPYFEDDVEPENPSQKAEDDEDDDENDEDDQPAQKKKKRTDDIEEDNDFELKNDDDEEFTDF